MKLKQPNITVNEIISGQNVTLNREDGRTHYINCHLTFDPELKELDEFHFTDCTFDSEIYSIHLIDCHFEKCRLINIAFNNISMRRILFDTCQLTGLTCENVNLTHVQFKDSKINLMNVIEGQLEAVYFSSCDLSESYFFHTMTKSWQLDQCRLTSASFIETPLAGIQLAGCDIEGITLKADDLRGAIVNRFQATELLPLFGIKVID